MGEIPVPKGRLWGAQTQRSLENFKIGTDRMPFPVISALALIKEAAAEVNSRNGLLDKGKASLIRRASREIQEGKWNDHFPLKVWQTGSGTQTNMNVNEVTAARAVQIFRAETGGAGKSAGRGGKSAERQADPADTSASDPAGDASAADGAAAGIAATSPAGSANVAEKTPEGGADSYSSAGAVHPNDHVNLSQSSNDVFPSAMRIAAVLTAKRRLLPALRRFERALAEKAASFQDIVKIGRTHLMDAVPLTLGQEFSAFREQAALSIQRVEGALPALLRLPLGGTAVGTGLNSFPGFAAEMCRALSAKTKEPFQPADNRFEAQAAHDSLVYMSGALKTLACSLMKIGNDIRLSGSGPRSGIAELILPANEPGSSIMPGKVNPTQCEALTMVCAQVMGQDLAISIGGSGGQLQLNAFKPLIIFNLLNSLNLLADVLDSFTEKCLKGLKPDRKKIQEHLNRSLMLVTALNPRIGYDKAAKIAQQAFQNGTSLREEAIALGFLTGKEFDSWVRPLEMTAPNLKPALRRSKPGKAKKG